MEEQMIFVYSDLLMQNEGCLRVSTKQKRKNAQKTILVPVVICNWEVFKGDKRL